MQIPDWLAWRHMRLHPNEKIKSYGILKYIKLYTTFNNFDCIACN